MTAIGRKRTHSAGTGAELPLRPSHIQRLTPRKNGGARASPFHQVPQSNYALVGTLTLSMPWRMPLLEPMSAEVTNAPSMLTLSLIIVIGAD